MILQIIVVRIIRYPRKNNLSYVAVPCPDIEYLVLAVRLEVYGECLPVRVVHVEGPAGAAPVFQYPDAVKVLAEDCINSVVEAGGGVQVCAAKSVTRSRLNCDGDKYQNHEKDCGENTSYDLSSVSLIFKSLIDILISMIRNKYEAINQVEKSHNNDT